MLAVLLASSLLLAGNLERASHDICTAIAGVNCGGGHDLVPLKNATVVSTPGACCAICQKTPQCNAWTWNGPHGNSMCYPKTACTKVGHANGHVSGSNVPIPPGPPPHPHPHPSPAPSPRPPSPPTPVPPPPTPPYPFQDHTLGWTARIANFVSLLN
eukprot:gene23746-17833_t